MIIHDSWQKKDGQVLTWTSSNLAIHPGFLKCGDSGPSSQNHQNLCRWKNRWKNPVESRRKYVPMADGRMKRTGQKNHHLPSFTIIYPCSANPWNFKYTWIWYDIYDQCLKAEYLCLPISSRDQSGVGRFLCYQSQDLEVLETALNERDAASASMDVLGGVHFSQQFTDLSCLCLKRSIDIKKDHNNKYLYLSCIETYSLQRIRTLLAALVGVIMHVFFLNTSHRLHRRPHCRKKRKSRPVKIMGQEPPKSLCNVASFLPKTSVVTLW